MKKISILALDDCTSIAPVGAMEIFRKTDALYQLLHRTTDRLFDAELVSQHGKVKFDNGLEWSTHHKIHELEHTDLLMIPAIEFDIEDKLEANRALIPHIQRLYEEGAEIASMCTGAFLLAETGLLAGKCATTHWAKAEEFKSRFPEVDVHDEKIIVDNGRIYTGGGATSFLNLVLYLIEKYGGKRVAVEASKMLLMDFNKPTQTHYQLFTPQMQHGDHEIATIQAYIHHADKMQMTVDDLAERSNLNRRTFSRRFIKATGENPASYLKRVQMEKAKDLFEASNMSVNEVAYEVGYNDIPSFRRVFKQITGFTPLEYRRMYTRTR
ncbi:MAG: helix-turn-helix domain-containing protein [Cyclobacteriaceae bacterium]|nr:helix-turn-helix domain-containing protein [Cyclobacteriaceae bacterium HetDA_MAG_MS6]